MGLLNDVKIELGLIVNSSAPGLEDATDFCLLDLHEWTMCIISIIHSLISYSLVCFLIVGFDLIALDLEFFFLNIRLNGRLRSSGSGERICSLLAYFVFFDWLICLKSWTYHIKALDLEEILRALSQILRGILFVRWAHISRTLGSQSHLKDLQMRWDTLLQRPLRFLNHAFVSLTEMTTGCRALHRVHLQLLFLLTYTFVLFRLEVLFL